MTTPEPAQDGIVRPDRIRGLRVVFFALLIAAVLGDLFVHHHDHFGIESTFGFSAWFGFLVCVLMIGGARLAGLLLRRPDDYYEKPGEDDHV